MSNELIRILVHVDGRASARWRSAKSGVEAARLNQALSTKRAFAVGMLVKRQIEAAIPGAKAIVTGTVVLPTDPKEINLGIRGLGSRNPLIPEGKDGDNPINRSAIVTLARVTSQLESNALWLDTAYLSLTTHWMMEVLKFEAGAFGAGNGDIQIRLTGLSGKSRRYEARLNGDGLDLPDPKQRDKPFTPETVYFSTGKPVGFGAFENNQITVWKAKVGPGVKIPGTPIKVGVNVSVTTLKFSGLGGTSDSVMIENEYGFGPSASGFIMRGPLRPIDPHPGDYTISGAMYEAVRMRRNTHQAGLIVPFETGESEMSSPIKAYAGKWALNWAMNLNAILMSASGP